jgi:hypothetical protein
LDSADAAAHLAAVLERLGTNYLPSCLAACPLAFHCREHARAVGDPGYLGSDARASLAGVASLPRALALAEGAAPAPDEAEVADLLQRAERLVAAALAPA